MRTFLLILIVAMAATVSCQDFPISVACNASSTALDNPTVNGAESYITKSGCTKLNFDKDYIINQCTENLGDGSRSCTCTTSLSNYSSWESAVTNSSGRACYIDLVISLTGTIIENNKSSPFVVINTLQNFSFFAVGNACNDTEIKGALLTPFATEGVGYLDSSLNANSNVTGVTWTSGSATVSACGASRTVPKVIPPSNAGGTTTTPPTTPTPSGSSSNTNSTSSPSTLPPVTPTPTSNSNSSSSSSSSSTGGKGTGTSTGNGNGNGASTVMVHSATAVMVALICSVVTVIGAA